MLGAIGVPALEALIDQTIPSGIRFSKGLNLPPAETEAGYLRRLRGVAAKNTVTRSCIGMGYYDTHTPAVILRNVFENPGWYTPYTPYQAEIAQGRLESLLNFQTMVTDLTGMEIASASLLDEGTAAAEAMTMFHRLNTKKTPAGQESVFLVRADLPQTIIQRAAPAPLETATPARPRMARWHPAEYPGRPRRGPHRDDARGARWPLRWPATSWRGPAGAAWGNGRTRRSATRSARRPAG